MGNFKKLLGNCSDEELDEKKIWLFQENVRIESERKELHQAQEQFIKEKKQFLYEVNQLQQKIQLQQKRNKQEENLLKKKQLILEQGFLQLDADKRMHQKEQKRAENIKNVEKEYYNYESFFVGVTNTLTLRKRYKDLIKIYHPDNLCGDKDIVERINKEYNY